MSRERQQRQSCWLPSGMATPVAAAPAYDPMLLSLASLPALSVSVLPSHADRAAPGTGVIIVLKRGNLREGDILWDSHLQPYA